MKGFWWSCVILAAILTASLLNNRALSQLSQRWSGALDEMQTLSDREDWDGVQQRLSRLQEDWDAHQLYLYTVLDHDILDETEALLRRSAQLARSAEQSEFRADCAALTVRMRLLSKLEAFSVQNIL